MKYYELTIVLHTPMRWTVVRGQTWKEMDAAITEAKAKYDGRWTSLTVTRLEVVTTADVVFCEGYLETPKPEVG